MPTGMSSSSLSIHSTKYTPLFSQENSSPNSSSSPSNSANPLNHWSFSSIFGRPARSSLGLVLLCLAFLSAVIVFLARIGISINSSGFNLFSSNSSSSSNWVQVDFFCHLPPLLSDDDLFCSAADFQTLLEANPLLVLLEPDYLVNVALLKRVVTLSRSSTKGSTTLNELRAQWEDFRWRFSLPAHFGHDRNSLTVGLIAPSSSSPAGSSIEETIKSLNLGNFSLVEAVHGPVHHQQKFSNSTLHLFYRRVISADLALHLHIAVLHPVEEFLWVGAIPGETVQRLGVVNNRAHPETSFRLHFGLNESEHAFDRLTPVAQVMAPLGSSSSSNENAPHHHQQHLITVPDDIEHFLSQVPTSRYLYCPPERGVAWFRAANRSINAKKEADSVQAFREMKALGRHLRMEFFIACGTLLGWYRQCHVTPYTSDTDFATWAKYLLPSKEGGVAQDLGPTFKEALENRDRSGTTHLRLYQRFGEPSATMEYSFALHGEKVDLFVLYGNGSHLLAPFHVPPTAQYGYNVYPKYSLCSSAFLGVRLLVPCTPLEIILSEYGSSWNKANDDYSYISSPRNTAGPLVHYNFTGKQHVYYE